MKKKEIQELIKDTIYSEKFGIEGVLGDWAKEEIRDLVTKTVIDLFTPEFLAWNSHGERPRVIKIRDEYCKNMKNIARAEMPKVAKKVIEGEDFIDKIVERIKKKQL